MNIELEFNLDAAAKTVRKSWRNILTRLLNWSKSEVDKWLTDADKTWDMTSQESLIFHEVPLYWVTETIVDHFLPSVSEEEFEYLDQRIQKALNANVTDFSDSRLNWTLLRNQLRSVIAEFKHHNTQVGTVQTLTNTPQLIAVDSKDTWSNTRGDAVVAWGVFDRDSSYLDISPEAHYGFVSEIPFFRLGAV